MVYMTETVSNEEALSDIRHHQWETNPPAATPVTSSKGA